MPEYAANPVRRADFKLHGRAGVRKFQLVLRQQGIRQRAMAYLDQGNSDGAIADIAQVIQRYPTNVYVYASRGFAYLQKGDFDRAIADYTRLIEVGTLYPSRFANVYRDRGIAYLIAGSLLKSLDDLNQASVRNPKDGYTALWLDVVTTRSNLPSHLAEAAQQLDMTKWPAPIIHLFLGETTPEEVLAAADDTDAKKKKGQVCEANFFSGERALQQGTKEEAVRLFRLAVEDCPKTFIEWSAASAELKG